MLRNAFSQSVNSDIYMRLRGFSPLTAFLKNSLAGACLCIHGKKRTDGACPYRIVLTFRFCRRVFDRTIRLVRLYYGYNALRENLVPILFQQTYEHLIT